MIPNIKGGKTSIPNHFIDKYFKQAPYIYCMIYIYACKMVSINEEIKNEIIANALRLPISEITNAWRYFEAEGIIEYSENPLKIIFNQDFFKPIPQNTEKKIITEKRPEYSPKEIDIFLQKNENIKNLLNSAQSHLNKMLTQNDISTILGFYDWLRLPLDVIEILFGYCTRNNHYSLRYIEAVALDWAEKNIDTPKKAIEYINLHNKDFRKIMKSMGIVNRIPTQSEQDFMQKWLFEYNLNINIICLAGEKTVNSTSMPSFPYTDRILTNWYKKNVKTIEDIKKIEDEFIKKSSSEISKKSQQNKKRNKFVNYQQREWDFEKLKLIEQEYMKKQLQNFDGDER